MPQAQIQLVAVHKFQTYLVVDQDPEREPDPAPPQPTQCKDLIVETTPAGLATLLSDMSASACLGSIVVIPSVDAETHVIVGELTGFTGMQIEEPRVVPGVAVPGAHGARRP
jgi:hypothetical protein